MAIKLVGDHGHYDVPKHKGLNASITVDRLRHKQAATIVKSGFDPKNPVGSMMNAERISFSTRKEAEELITYIRQVVDYMEDAQ